ncbi:MAG: hypothetical protein IT428_03770 [Planctomycetaceae bacterium]|nr:hypothetical protein [Planctomycetaceae bacterium]
MQKKTDSRTDFHSPISPDSPLHRVLQLVAREIVARLQHQEQERIVDAPVNHLISKAKESAVVEPR